MRKEKRFYIIDMILMLLMLGIGIAAFLCCLSFWTSSSKMDYDWSSTNWCFMAYFSTLSFKKMPLWVRILRRCFVLLLCVLLGFSGYLLHKSHQTLNKVSVQL